MKYLENKVEGVKIAYVGGGSRGWAWGLMSDLVSVDDISGDVYLYDIDMKNGTAEVGYKTMADKGIRMQGDIDDALQGMLNYAFKELRLNCVIAHTLSDNVPSEKLLVRNGFVQEGLLRQRIYQSGCYVDMKVFSIIENEFSMEKR